MDGGRFEVNLGISRAALRQRILVWSYSWFGHIEALAIRLVVLALIVSGDNS
jgi:hypothetical protein